MPSKEPVSYLLHIRDCCREIETCAELRGNGQVPESVVFAAVCRNLEIIGEAAGKLGADFHAAHPGIPWRQMIGARNILIHNYDGVDPGIVWGIVDKDIPDLIAAVDRLLRS